MTTPPLQELTPPFCFRCAGERRGHTERGGLARAADTDGLPPHVSSHSTLRRQEPLGEEVRLSVLRQSVSTRLVSLHSREVPVRQRAGLSMSLLSTQD